MSKFQKTFLTASAFVALSVTAATAATTPYDLIRPTWPLSWDSTEFENFDDTTGVEIIGALPKEVVPPNFKAGELMADTVDQAYLDAINQHISPIRVNQAGYLESDKERQFYFVGDAKEFEVVDEMGKSLSTKVTGEFTATSYTTASDWTIKAGIDKCTAASKRYSINFTGTSGTIQVGNVPQSVPTGKRLRIKVGDELSSTFIVSEDVYTMVKDATIKFFGIQRSGNSSSWFHGPSHTQDGAGTVTNVTDGAKAAAELTGLKTGDLQGGWYDCGDHLKLSKTMSYAFMSLAVMSATNPSKDVDHYAYNHADFVNTDKVPDMLREAKHGADFFLRAYRAAKGVIDDMPVSIGNFGYDHSGWTRPEVQDDFPANRGGASGRDVRLGELGANVSSEIAAGLAILGKDYAKYDKDFADSCLKVAEEMYDFAKNLALDNSTYGDGKEFKNNQKLFMTAEYIGNYEFYEDLALASVALLYATGKKDYLNDAILDKDIGTAQESSFEFFKGGWMAFSRDGMRKNENTSWGAQHTFALYALYKLILSDKDQAEAFGLTEEDRLAAIESCVSTMINNFERLSTDGQELNLPMKFQYPFSYNPTWYNMRTNSDKNNDYYNRYYVGNTFDVLTYADVAADIEKQGITLPNMGTPEWKADKMRTLGINQLNYLLGVNPWDISFVYGVGDKNDNHPHHRASNPEGRNSFTFTYKYVRPVGGLFGAIHPNETNSMIPSSLSWDDFHLSDVCLDASATLTSALTLVSNGGSKYYEKKCDNCGKGDLNPFTTSKPYATAYQYKWDKMQGISLWIYNNTMNAQDSLTAYIYYEATEEEVKNGKIKFDLEICTLRGDFGNSSFITTCPSDQELREELRNGNSQKIESSFNKDTKTYTWALPLTIDSIPFGAALHMDLVAWAYRDSTERLPSTVDISKSWSLAAHKAEDGKPAYEGAPSWDKDQGDIQDPPENPYIVIERNSKRIWGYAPNDIVEVKKDTTATDSSKSDSTKVDDKDDSKKDSTKVNDKDDGKKDDGIKDDGKSDDKKKDDSKKDDGKKDDSKKDSKKDGIVASIPSMQSSLHVAGRTLIAQAPAQGTKALKVFDLLGNEIMSEAFYGESASVNLANVSKRGTLVARLVMNGKVLNTKAIRVK